MALYTSDRERRLWLWTLVVLTAIYSTLWVTPSLTGPLPTLDESLVDEDRDQSVPMAPYAPVRRASLARPRGTYRL